MISLRICAYWKSVPGKSKRLQAFVLYFSIFNFFILQGCQLLNEFLYKLMMIKSIYRWGKQQENEDARTKASKQTTNRNFKSKSVQKNKMHVSRRWTFQSELPIVFELDGVRIVEELVTGKLLEQLYRPETTPLDMHEINVWLNIINY